MCKSMILNENMCFHSVNIKKDRGKEGTISNKNRNQCPKIHHGFFSKNRPEIIKNISKVHDNKIFPNLLVLTFSFTVLANTRTK